MNNTDISNLMKVINRHKCNCYCDGVNSDIALNSLLKELEEFCKVRVEEDDGKN